MINFIRGDYQLFTPNQSSITRVHTSDVSLKNQSEIEYKCHEWAFISFYCYQTTVAEVHLMPLPSRYIQDQSTWKRAAAWRTTAATLW